MIELSVTADLSSGGRLFKLHKSSMSIHKGEATAVIGPSGSGKTTFLSAISGIMGQRDMQPAVPTLGIVRHQNTMPSWMTLNDVVAAEEKLRRRPVSTNDLDELVEKFELGRTIFKSHAWELSHGMRQRFEIAKAISFNVDLLLLDEGLGGIHQKAKDTVISEIHHRLSNQRFSLIFVTHDLFDVARLADNVIVFNEGEIVCRHDVDAPRAERFRQHGRGLVDLAESIFDLT